MNMDAKPTTLLEIAKGLSDLDDEHTIYAVKPWTPYSVACAVDELGESCLPETRGAAYLIEVNIGRRFLASWFEVDDVKEVPSLELCERLIQYATNDA